jgi:hypothetical protein
MRWPEQEKVDPAKRKDRDPEAGERPVLSLLLLSYAFPVRPIYDEPFDHAVAVTERSIRLCSAARRSFEIGWIKFLQALEQCGNRKADEWEGSKRANWERG